MTLSHITLASLCLSAGMTAYTLWIACRKVDGIKAGGVALFTIWFLLSFAGLLAEIVRRGE